MTLGPTAMIDNQSHECPKVETGEHTRPKPHSPSFSLFPNMERERRIDSMSENCPPTLGEQYPGYVQETVLGFACDCEGVEDLRAYKGGNLPAYFIIQKDFLLHVAVNH
jgi:hypothetical protein